MIGTEKELKQKRCTPSMVIWLLDPERKNGLQAAGADVTDKCIGSACAQWCWYDFTRDGHSTHVRLGAAGQFERGRVEGGPGMRATAPRGYCGLTGSKE